MPDGQQRRLAFTGVASEAVLSDIHLSPFTNQRFGPLSVEGRRLPLFDAQRASGAGPQAEASTVAKLLPHNPGLPIHDLDGTLGTRRHTRAAAIAEFRINPHNLSNRHTVLQSISESRVPVCYVAP
jgi:hypothetical protein